jgi:hypothetical protein
MRHRSGSSRSLSLPVPEIAAVNRCATQRRSARIGYLVGCNFERRSRVGRAALPVLPRLARKVRSRTWGTGLSASRIRCLLGRYTLLGSEGTPAAKAAQHQHLNRSGEPLHYPNTQKLDPSSIRRHLHKFSLDGLGWRSAFSASSCRGPPVTAPPNRNVLYSPAEIL